MEISFTDQRFFIELSLGMFRLVIGR